jgi:hypothetical protein
VVGLTHRQAEGLLDWLQNHGCTKVEVELEEGGGFTVRFVFPPPDTGGPGMTAETAS